MTYLPQGISQLANGVYQAHGNYSVFNDELADFLVHDATYNDKKRSRINFHPSPASHARDGHFFRPINNLESTVI